jgi:hypothetical protein
MRMSRTVMGLMAAGSVLAVPSAAASDAGSTYSVGGGWRAGGCAIVVIGACPGIAMTGRVHFAYSAHIDGGGGVSGEASFDRPGGLHFTGDIDCLNVVANEAEISGTILQANASLAGIQRFLFRVRDNGQSASGTPDQMSAVILYPVPPDPFSALQLLATFPGAGFGSSDCEAPFIGNFLTVTEGDLSVEP